MHPPLKKMKPEKNQMPDPKTRHDLTIYLKIVHDLSLNGAVFLFSLMGKLFTWNRFSNMLKKCKLIHRGCHCVIYLQIVLGSIRK